MINLKKFSLVAALVFALVLSAGAGSAQATLTFDATSVVSSAALGLSGAAGSAITIGNAAQTGTITLGSSSGNGIIDIGAGAGVTTVQLGVSAGADVITVGDADADVSILDAQWGITAAGAATFQSTLTTGNITAYGAGADQAFTVASKGAGTLTLDPTGAGAIVIGSADVLSLTVTTVGTGTAAVVLPVGSIDSTEILNATVVETDIAASSATGLGVLRTARAKYDFSVDGGLVGAITPASTAVLPDNAVIVAATINSTTAVTSDGAATLAVGTTAGSSATSILGATAKTLFSVDALINGVPAFGEPLKMSAAGSINVTVGTANLTAGVVEITLLYFVAAN